MTSQTADATYCACGCGTEIRPGSKWARGHFQRGENGAVAPLPGPDDEIDLDDIFGPVPAPSESPGPAVADGPGGELPPDEPPAPIPADAPRRGRAGSARVTAAARKDISAKISLALELPGRVWAARDPYCGGTFIGQRPAIADALTDIVCDSPDLVEWFAGPAGGFMKYLKLAAALQPVAVVVYGHHITHAIGQEGEHEGQQPQDMSRYAA